MELFSIVQEKPDKWTDQTDNNIATERLLSSDLSTMERVKSLVYESQEKLLDSTEVKEKK